MIKVLGSSSSGNAVVYHKEIMVDCGLPFSHLENDYKNISLVLLTHQHTDHLNKPTIETLLKKRPSIMFGVPIHLVSYLEKKSIHIPKKNTVILEANKIYKFKHYTISPVKLYHDVENYGYRIINDKTGHKTLHATDTNTLDGIKAYHYDLYALERNYEGSTIMDVITDKISKGQFAYEVRAIKNHLSFEQCDEFFNKNKKESSVLVPLHVSNRYDGEDSSE